MTPDEMFTLHATTAAEQGVWRRARFVGGTEADAMDALRFHRLLGVLGKLGEPPRDPEKLAAMLEHLERSAALHYRSAFMLPPAHVEHVSSDELRELRARAEERRRRAEQQAALRARLARRPS